MAEDMMNEEMTGIGMPTTEAPMPTEEPMAEDATMEEPSTLDATTMASNFNALPPEEKKVIGSLFEGPALPAMQKLLGEALVNDFTAQMTLDEAPAEEEPAGMMAPTEEPMAEAPEAMPMEDEEATPPV